MSVLTGAESTSNFNAIRADPDLRISMSADFLHYDLGLQGHAEYVRRSVACSACRRARRRCIRPDPGSSCQWCTAHGLNCQTYIRKYFDPRLITKDPSYPHGNNFTSVSPSSSYYTAASSFGDTSPALPVVQTGETGAGIGQQAPAAAIDTLACVSPTILSGLTHLDLTHSVIFNEKKVVAGGSYGDICTGSCTVLGRGKIKVAIKRLRFWCKDDIETLFTKEIYVWSKLSHRNILPLLGYAIDKSTEFPMLISEWMENGSAWNFVNRHLDCDIMRLLVGTACGLHYLHSLGVVHSDIKSDNIMVSKVGDALICDFGCARMVDASRSFANLTSGIHGTSRYLAYELVVPLDSSAEVPTIHSMKTDVWAFGMTMYELCTLRRPFANLRETQVIYVVGKRKLPQFPTSSPLDISRKTYGEIEKLCLGCWNHEPTERSSMASVLSELRSIWYWAGVYVGNYF